MMRTTLFGYGWAEKNAPVEPEQTREQGKRTEQNGHVFLSSLRK